MPTSLWISLVVCACGLAGLIYLFTVASAHDVRSEWNDETAEALRKN